MATFLEAWHALDELKPRLPETDDETIFVNERYLRRRIGARAHDEQFQAQRGEPWKQFRNRCPYAWEYIYAQRRFRRALRRLMNALVESDGRWT